jgi:hypothetical protein
MTSETNVDVEWGKHMLTKTLQRTRKLSFIQHSIFVDVVLLRYLGESRLRRLRRRHLGLVGVSHHALLDLSDKCIVCLRFVVGQDGVALGDVDVGHDDVWCCIWLACTMLCVRTFR